ncbi:MAG: glycosyltransferase family 2 protein [Planctomycetes bacterium]|nr:glycosyltransferase family 2 protein [Planctomycetota bacterium]
MIASVIVCVYNRGEQVQACLDSLLAMERHDFEFVLVNDGSTDDTAQRLEDFRTEHPDRAVTVVHNRRNLGTAGARNVGLVAAAGDLVFFTDSDCTVSPGWLGELLHCFDDPTIAAAAGPILTPPPTNLAERAYAESSRTRATKWHQRDVAGGSMGFRREIALALRFDEALTHYCDEDELAWRLREEDHRFAFAPRATVVHHHPLTLRSYLRMGFRQGMGSARFWYKRGRYIGRDLWAGMLGLLTLPLGLIDANWLGVSAMCFVLQLAAIIFNERVLKGKRVAETIVVLPVCTLFYICKFGGVLVVWARFFLGKEDAVRRSKRLWRETRGAESPRSGNTT